MGEDAERATFEDAFQIALNLRKEWERLKAVTAVWQQKAFAKQIEYYEAAQVLEDARDAWTKAESKRKKAE